METTKKIDYVKILQILLEITRDRAGYTEVIKLEKNGIDSCKSFSIYSEDPEKTPGNTEIK